MSFFSLSQDKFEYAYSTGRNDQARAVVQSYDSGYVVIGNTENYDGNTDVYLMKTDSRGNFLWAKRFGSFGNDGGEDIIQLADSGFAIVGYTFQNGSYEMLFVRTDKNGNELFSKYFGGTDWEFGYSIQPTSDNGFLLAGESYKNGNNDGYLVKLNTAGDSIWTKKIGGNGNDKFEDVIVASNGDYILAGETTSFGNNEQAYVVRTDTSGNIIWQNNFGNPGIDFAKSILEISTGDIVFAGGTNTVPFPDIDNWGAKISSTGVFIENHIVFDYEPTPPIDQNDDWNQFVIAQKDSVIFGGKRSYQNIEKGNIYLYRYSQTIDFAGYLADFQKFMTTNQEMAYDAKITLDQGVIIACTGEGIDSSPSSIYLIKMDSTLAWPHPFFNSIMFQNDYTSLVEKEKLEVTIYPNPTQTFVTISLNNEVKNFNIRVVGINGKVVSENFVNSYTYQIDFSPLPSGIYFLQIETETKNITKKIVVSR